MLRRSVRLVSPLPALMTSLFHSLYHSPSCFLPCYAGDAGTSASAGAPSSSKKTTGKRAASADQGGKRQKTLEESMTKKGASVQLQRLGLLRKSVAALLRAFWRVAAQVLYLCLPLLLPPQIDFMLLYKQPDVQESTVRAGGVRKHDV
eukprot:863050-Pelagomonas_calceolata.AAC.3